MFGISSTTTAWAFLGTSSSVDCALCWLSSHVLSTESVLVEGLLWYSMAHKIHKIRYGPKDFYTEMLVPRMEVPVVESLKGWSQRSVLKSLRTYHSPGLKFWDSDSVCQQQRIITKWANLVNVITSIQTPTIVMSSVMGTLLETEHKSLPIFYFQPSKLHTRQPHPYTRYLVVATD